MPLAIVINEYGDSSVLQLQEVEVPAPGPGELRLRQLSVGVNFHDIYVRSGLYKTLTPPGILGCEAAGVVEAVGDGVSDFHVGDRVAYVTGPPYGAYASHRVLAANLVVPLPDGIDDDLAAAVLLRALTVDMLARQVVQLKPGMSILVHAAAGGVGRLLCQQAAHLGVTVYGTVGSEEKAEIARASGCAHPILYRKVAFEDEVTRLTEGRGVDVVYDSIGADTFAGSLTVLAPCGHLVNFGQSSGPVEPVAMSTLAEKSLTVTRPILFHYIGETEKNREMAAAVFQGFAKGILWTEAPTVLPLAEAHAAHDQLESRKATAGVVLKP
ncbi:quinone oxidoreductase [Alisedimentitalea sp. MJ-SS2]|uniref:quinone oxidoreductase family protein n=1 Tax=Aliisedimentitalea sp. MJ-SS2 TaxID=3049795 RepID=UPI00290F043D|nr:quinone oxidoreductase [Alisedimentitalea sp. MJ-SS2]MDU8928200.1 quinone oxidoreductase [Alisedimentitalea sp. MJ-SS2]